MSFDNAESRNSSVNVGNTRIPLPRRVQCCSFCRNPGHNIMRCNSDRLTEFEVICAAEVRNINTRFEFREWLYENYCNEPTLIRVFARRKSRVSTGDFTLCIEIITDYIFRTYKNNQQQRQNDDDLEGDLVNLMQEVRNPPVREIVQETFYWQNLVSIYMIEMALLNLSYDIINQNAREEPRRLNINLTYEKDIIENITEKCKCNICWDEKDKDSFVTLGCNHEFCGECVKSCIKSDTRLAPCCALCRTEIKNIKTRTHEIHSEISELTV